MFNFIKWDKYDTSFVANMGCMTIEEICDKHDLVLYNSWETATLKCYRFRSRSYVENEDYIGVWIEVSDDVTHDDYLTNRHVSVKERSGKKFADFFNNLGPLRYSAWKWRGKKKKYSLPNSHKDEEEKTDNQRV